MAKELSDIMTRAAAELAEVTAALSGLLSPELLTKLNAAYTKSGTNQTAIETRRSEIAELTERLKGRSDYSLDFSQFSRENVRMTYQSLRIYIP